MKSGGCSSCELAPAGLGSCRSIRVEDVQSFRPSGNLAEPIWGRTTPVSALASELLLPDHVDQQDDKLRTKNLERYLTFLLGPLVEGIGGEADNLSLLLQMLDTITSSYQDALEPSNDRIQTTARVAGQVRL